MADSECQVAPVATADKEDKMASTPEKVIGDVAVAVAAEEPKPATHVVAAPASPEKACNHALIFTETEAELKQFPAFERQKKGTPKSKSLTAVEMAMEVITEHQVTEAFERLKTEDPPLSLEQTRARRASIKEERKANIDFIRSRTSSRASANASARPSFEATPSFDKCGLGGRPSSEDLAEELAKISSRNEE